MKTQSTVGALYSGGLDSSILLGHLLELGKRVQPFFIRSGLVWQREELLAIELFLAAANRSNLQPLVVLDLPLHDLYDGHWSTTACDTPDCSSKDQAVFMPGRNVLLVVKAAIWCQLHGISELCLGLLGTSPFEDAATPFFDNLQAVLNCGPSDAVRITRPFAAFDKAAVMRLGRDLPLELTFSCIAPVSGLHCGRCNKCAERTAAFRAGGMPDPTEYAASGISDPVLRTTIQSSK